MPNIFNPSKKIHSLLRCSTHRFYLIFLPFLLLLPTNEVTFLPRSGTFSFPFCPPLHRPPLRRFSLYTSFCFFSFVSPGQEGKEALQLFVSLFMDFIIHSSLFTFFFPCFCSTYSVFLRLQHFFFFSVVSAHFLPTKRFIFLRV